VDVKTEEGREKREMRRKKNEKRVQRQN